MLQIMLVRGTERMSGEQIAAAAELAAVGWEFFDAYAANVRKVMPADVQRVAQKFLGTLRTVVVQAQ
jgi:hypothetical protein